MTDKERSKKAEREDEKIRERGRRTMVKRQVPFAGHATDGPKF